MTVSTVAAISGSQMRSTCSTSSASHQSPSRWMSGASSAVGTAISSLPGAASATARWQAGHPTPSSELDVVDRVLDLRQDRLAERLALVRLEALHRRDDAGHDQRDEQDQGDVLDRPLTGLVAQPDGPCMDVSEQRVHR